MKQILAALAAALFAASAANAADEWRVIGPSASYHFTDHGARKVAADGGWACAQIRSSIGDEPGAWAWAGEAFNVASPMAGGDPLAPAPELLAAMSATPGSVSVFSSIYSGEHSANSVYTIVSYDALPSGVKMGVQCHPQVRYRSEWSSNNPSFGLERAWRYSTHVDKAFVVAVRDSYGAPSLMVGGGRQWPLGSLGTVSFDGGVVGGLWNRKTSPNDGYTLQRRTIPFVLPVVSFTESTTGLGANVGLAPRIRLPGGSGRYTSLDTTLMFQLTWLVKKDEGPSVSVTNVDGGVEATFGLPF